MKKILCLGLMALMGCGQIKVTKTNNTVNNGGVVPSDYKFDKNPDLSHRDEAKVQEAMDHVDMTTKDKTKSIPEKVKVTVEAKLKEMDSKIRSDVKSGLNASYIVEMRANEYVQWVQGQEDQPTSISDWVWGKVKEAFQYDVQLRKLKDAFIVFANGVVCSEHGKELYVDAVGTVTGISVEILAGAGFVAFDPSFGVLTTFLVMPTGYIGGSALGQFVLGPFLFDLHCK